MIWGGAIRNGCSHLIKMRLFSKSYLVSSPCYLIPNYLIPVSCFTV